MGLLITSCNFLYQSDMYFPIITDFFICFVAPESSYEFISRSYDCASSHTLKFQLRWPRSLNLFDSKNIDLSTELCGRLFKRTKYNRVFRWHNMLGGNIPTSPTSITLLVLCFTCNITFRNQWKTLSNDFWAVIFIPHTSLPYNKIGCIRLWYIWKVHRGGILRFFTLLSMANADCLALSHK